MIKSSIVLKFSRCVCNNRLDIKGLSSRTTEVVLDHQVCKALSMFSSNRADRHHIEIMVDIDAQVCAVDMNRWSDRCAVLDLSVQKLVFKLYYRVFVSRICRIDLPSEMIAAVSLTMDLFLIFRITDVTGGAIHKVFKHRHDFIFLRFCFIITAHPAPLRALCFYPFYFVKTVQMMHRYNCRFSP